MMKAGGSPVSNEHSSDALLVMEGLPTVNGSAIPISIVRSNIKSLRMNLVWSRFAIGDDGALRI